MNRRSSRQRRLLPFIVLSLFAALWMIMVTWQLSTTPSSSLATVERRASGGKQHPFSSIGRADENASITSPRVLTAVPKMETKQVKKKKVEKHDSAASKQRRSEEPSTSEQVRLVLFSTLKPCVSDAVRYAQLDAVTTWLALRTSSAGGASSLPRVALLGSGESGKCAAWVRSSLLSEESQSRVLLVPDAVEGPHGTVLLGSAIRQVEKLFPTANVFAFVNGDILFHPAASRAIATAFSQFTSFFLIGHRSTVKIPVELRHSFHHLLHNEEEGEHKPSEATEGSKLLNFDLSNPWYRHPAFSTGEVSADRTDAEDFFFWSRDFFTRGGIDVPPFHIGRPAYDNWLVHASIHTWMPVIDATDVLLAYHQQHSYEHLSSPSGPDGGEGGKKSYWGGKEQEENYALGVDHGGWQHGLIDFAPLRFGPDQACTDELRSADQQDPRLSSCRIGMKKDWKPFTENSLSSDKNVFAKRYATFCKTSLPCSLQET